MIVDDRDDEVLVGDVGTNRQIADAAAVRHHDPIAGTRRQAVHGDDQPVRHGSGRRLRTDEQQLAGGETRPLPRRPEPPDDPAQDHGSTGTVSASRPSRARTSPLPPTSSPWRSSPASPPSWGPPQRRPAWLPARPWPRPASRRRP